MDQQATYAGKCFCGAVEFTVTGEPIAMGYCHCESCRHWSAGPVTAFTLWKPENVRVTSGEAHVGTFNRTNRSFRKWCKVCGGHIFTEHPIMDVTDVYAPIIPDLKFQPTLHAHYEETVMCAKDGLPKMQDVPKELGGSGVLMPE
jgi:hypothetical protein